MFNRIIHPAIEPGIIEDVMLTQTIIEQGPKGEPGRLYAEQGVDYEKITFIRLEFKRLLRIDHLWVMPYLTKLSLAHNLIEKIKNLDGLINLIELDLSFNKIEKIENLDKLVKVEVLTLFSNKITVLENLDALEDLLIFSIGDNLIDDLRQVEYLRKFKKLRSLSYRGNPCLVDDWAQAFLYAVLPNLTYLDYKRLTEEQREDGLSKHRGRLRVLAEADEAAEKLRLQQEERRKLVEHYTSLLVEGLQGYEAFDNLFKGSEVEQWSSEHNDIKDCYLGYRERYYNIMIEFVNYAEELFSRREKEVYCYYKVIEAALNESVKKSQADIVKYQENRVPLYSALDSYIADVDEKTRTLEQAEKAVLEIIDQLYDILHKLWRKLMEQEMNLFESSLLTRTQLSDCLTNLADSFISKGREAFRLWQNADDDWNEDIFKTITDLITHNRLGFLSDENLEIFRDEELLREKLEIHQEIRRSYMEEKQVEIYELARAWSDERIAKANEEEIKRNRERVVEINYFLDNEREAWSEKQALLNEKPDADWAAILEDI